MATMLELYESKKSLAANQGGPDSAKVDANISIDQIPYSIGENKNGGKAPDVGAIDGAAEFSVVSPGNRYGFQGATIGGGTTNLPNGWNDTNLYGASNPQ
jgi:hypothetical protein